MWRTNSYDFPHFLSPQNSPTIEVSKQARNIILQFLEGMDNMPSTGFGGQYYSISVSGMMLFQQGPFETGMGGIVVDLASAPIEPGDYTLEFKTAMGGIEIYLPRYVQFMINGQAGFGGANIHEGLGIWKSLTHKLKGTLHLPDQIPDHAVASADLERPIRINFIFHTGMGGIDIYRI